MPSLQFNQQTIFTQGDQVSTLYKLTQGSVTLLNQEIPIVQVQAPYYLNLLEHIYGVPALKTVRAYDKCLIQKIRKPTETHKAALRTWKEKGFRKSKFQIFEELHAALFYELLRYGTIVEIGKQNSLPALQDQIYLVADGTLEASGGHPTLRYLSLASGETIVASNPHTYLHAVSERAILMAIPISTAKVLLGDQFNTIEQFMGHQQRAMNTFEVRNERLSHEIRKNRDGGLSRVKIPLEFVNKIEEKAKNFQKYCRTKSCLGRLAPKSRSLVHAENQERFKELVELNRRKYGQEYILQKRMEVGHKLSSQSCSLSPRSSSQQIYDPSHIKQPYAMLFSHPLVEQWNQLRSGKSRLRKVGRQTREKQPLFQCTGVHRVAQANLTFSN